MADELPFKVSAGRAYSIRMLEARLKRISELNESVVKKATTMLTSGFAMFAAMGTAKMLPGADAGLLSTFAMAMASWSLVCLVLETTKIWSEHRAVVPLKTVNVDVLNQRYIEATPANAEDHSKLANAVIGDLLSAVAGVEKMNEEHGKRLDCVVSLLRDTTIWLGVALTAIPIDRLIFAAWTAWRASVAQ